VSTLFMAGVTGTNGKTSVTQWFAQAMTALGRKCAVIGTLGNGFPGTLLPGPNTTPGAAVLRTLLPDLEAQGAQACAMEVSSIGLHQNRVAGIHFDVAVFTNLTRDHLDYHGTMAEYTAQKRKLFAMPGLACAVLNLDDPFGAQLDTELAGHMRVIGYTLEGKTSCGETLAAHDLLATAEGISFRVSDVRMSAPLIGRFNAANLLALIGALLAAGETLAAIADVLPGLAPPPGRMQGIGGNAAPLVVIDYAHTPDALEQALLTLKEIAATRDGKLICVFGCGGNRDAGKRPLMGAVAERLADETLITSDNPREEDPVKIIEDIVGGMTRQTPIETDRARAIARAVTAADRRAVILLAGKGHETYQEIAGVRYPFSDLAQTRQALEEYR
jgi:UDP-N-acetylmuramoyl-L-alanyl-D-glutamate--2,6-diaminopimelate ligase